MGIIDGIIGPVAGLLDKIIPDPKARDAAKLELLKLEGIQDMERTRAQMAAVLAEAQSTDRGPAARDRRSSMSCTRCCCGRSRWG